MTARPSATALLALVAVICLGAVGMALVSQHVYGMLPCPWCVLQRFIFSLIGLVALAGLLARAWAGRRAASGTAAKGCALVVGLLAAAGITTALWQHFVAAASASCNLTLADRIMGATGLDQLLPDVYAAWASCADAAVKMFGISYEFYSLALFVVLLAAAMLLWRRAGADRRPAFG